MIKEKQSSWLTINGIEQRYNLELQHHYDEVGNRIKTILPDGKEINQLYYGSGHLYNQSLFDPSTDQHIELRHSERNKLHLEVSRQQGTITHTYDYSPVGQLVKQQVRAPQHLAIERSYQYDPIGQLIDVQSHTSLALGSEPDYSQSHRHRYQYDAVGRLIQHDALGSRSNFTERFAFDPSSNRRPVHSSDLENGRAASNQMLETYRANGRPSEITSGNHLIHYRYDEHDRVSHKTIVERGSRDGKALSQKALIMSYNTDHKLSESILTVKDNQDSTVTSTHYYHDALGRRIHKHSVTQKGDQVQQRQMHILWSGDAPIQEYTDSHVYSTIYDQDSFTPIARLVWAQDTIADSENDKGIGQTDTAIRTYYYSNDQLGTPQELVDDNGKLIWQANYQAWGNVHTQVYWDSTTDSYQEAAHDTVQLEYLQPIRFQGQHFDSETGLHHNDFRYYDPDMGMFTSRDPIGLMGGNNIFAYAPNPTGWVDPLGLMRGLSRGSITKAEGMNQARVMNGDGPLCNIFGIGCNDDHYKCTSATYEGENGSKKTVNYEDYDEARIAPTGVLWPPTPSYVEEQGGKCNEVLGRPGREYIIK